MRPIDIAPTDLETVRCILREHAPGLEVHAFGSRVSWTARETSDLDIALLTEEPLSIARITNLKAVFTKSYLPFRVDIVDWASTSENFRKVIEREHVVLVERHRTTKLDGWRKLQFGDAFQVNPRVHLKRGNVYPFVSMAVVDTNSRDTYAVERRKFSSGGSRFANGDTLMARITPCLENGKITRFCSSDLSNFGHGSTEFIVIRGTPNLTVNEFAYYLTRSEQVRSYAIKQMTGTSGRQRVPTDSLIRLIVSIPPLSEQLSIAQILGTLDDKIELNHRMNKTLEEMTQALFKSWFIDFEPVKTKLAVLEKCGTAEEAERAAMCAISGKDKITLAKLENEQSKAFANLAQTAAQFPSAMQDSELGKIPKDWDACNLGDVVTSVRGRSYRSSELSPSDTALVTLKSFERGGGYRADGLKSFTGKYYANQVVQPGEIVIACTDVTQAADVIGRPAIVQSSNAYKSLVASLDTLIVRPNSKNITRSFLYYLTKSSVFTSHTNAYSTGTTVLHLAKEAIPLFQFPLPPPQLIDTFDKLAKSAIELIRINNLESESLVSTRNCLLPKLVSGEVRVQEFYNQKIQNLEIP